MSWALLLLLHGAPITIRGNVALPEDVYRTVLTLSAGTRTSTPTPDQVASSLTDFLHASGYTIASATATVAQDGTIVVDVDEGRLDKIIFPEESAANAIQLQLAFAMPGRIFNRPLLEKKIQKLIEETDVVDVEYRVVPVVEPEHPGIQVEDPGLIHGFTFFKAGEPHELRIKVQHEGWKRGLDVGFGYKPPDGLFVKGGYKHGGLFFDQDLGELTSRVAVRVVDAFTTANARLGLSEASLGLRWYTPPFAGDSLRSFLSVEGLALGRRRQDLGVKSYLHSPIRGSLNFGVNIFSYLRLDLGLGAEQRFLYALRDEEDVPRSPVVDETPRSQLRMFARAELEAVFNPEELRRDRKHRLILAARHLSGGTEEGKPITETLLRYQKMFSFGWDELWIGVSGGLLFGEVPFYDELSVGGDYVRNTFSQVFVQKAAALHLEYRLSLSRDFFKIGLYNDLAVYGELDDLRRTETFRIADGVGIGLHLMVLDTFQFSGYFGVGISSGEEFDVGFGLQAEQAF